MRIAYTTRRGLKGKASRGGATGGRVLGYMRVVTGQDAQGRDLDCLAIEEEQAALVRRIFLLYADGRSLKQICNTLNAEGIPSPAPASAASTMPASGTRPRCRAT